MRTAKLKPGELRAYWRTLREDGYHGPGGEKGDLVFHNEPPARRADGSLLYSVFSSYKIDGSSINGRSLVEELARRGYDVTTFRFSIKMKEGTKL